MLNKLEPESVGQFCLKSEDWLMTDRYSAITETMFDSVAAGAAGSEAAGLRQLSVCSTAAGTF